MASTSGVMFIINHLTGQHDRNQTTTATLINAAVTNIQVKDLKEAFNLYDRKGTGSISSNDLGSLLRAIGQNPSEAEIKELINQAEATLSFDAFSKIALRADGFKPAGTVDQLVEGFKVFDPKDNGTIPVEDLRRILSTMGEALSKEELDALLVNAKIDSKGNISYEELVRDILK
ncbi:hypothetical protein BGZ67_007352 [Mortierella alpina]|nr:hypothetical protein BGZ67_007352 [Mortierella alpina]